MSYFLRLFDLMVEVMLPIVVPDAGRDFAGRPLADRLLEEPVILGQLEVDHYEKRGILAHPLSLYIGYIREMVILAPRPSSSRSAALPPVTATSR